MNLLIVDHSKLFQDIVGQIFRGADSQATAAHTGADAIAALSAANFDFICITLHLQDTDGIELARRIRKLPGYAYVPIVLFTAEKSGAVHQEALMNGVTEVFQKQDVDQLANFAARFVVRARQMEGRVLFVEDSAAQAAIISAMFVARGLQVTTLTTAEAAWDVFREQEFDLIVTDIVLAGQMSGLTFANRVRRLPDDRGDVPILAITAFDDMARRIELFYLGVNDYAIKPVVEEELMARVRGLLQNRRLTQEIKRRKTIAETAARLSNVMVAEFDEQWCWKDVPANLCTPLGGSESDFIGQPECRWVHADHLAEEAALRETMQLGDNLSSYAMEKRYCGHDGATLWVYFNAMVICNEQRKPVGFLAYILDISERKRAEIQSQLATKVFEVSHEGILVTNAERRIISVNRAICEITGYPETELLGNTPKRLSSNHHDAAFYQSMWHSLHNHGHWSGELFDRRKSGELYPVWLSISTIKDTRGAVTHYVGIHRDLSEQHSLRNQLQRFANYDALTGVANRFHLDQRLQDQLDAAKHRQGMLAVIFLDLDLFKRINESLGHPAGDRLLKEVARRLSALSAENDCLARWGGDEFALVCSDIHSADEAKARAESLLVKLAEPFQLDEHSIALSASLGISLYPDDGASSTALLKKAEIATHHGKTAMRGGYHFFRESMELAAVENLIMENELRSAIHEGQLLLYYQPQFNMQDGRLIGWEALIRWQHPRFGMVPPIKFIPLAESSRLIVELGQWVMRTACLQSRRWQSLGYPQVPIAINISALQFRTGDFFQSVKETLQETGITGASLELELTESILMGEEESVIGLLQSLKSLGVSLSIDDFGTGYSSLAYLKRFPVDRLKIDQAFVRDATHDPDDATIITAIINMAKSLRLSVIAEGVETAEQAALLMQCGCYEAQGFYYGRPGPAESMGEYMSNASLQPRSIPV
ncbi:MAG: EAL domain-containing protein [Methylococcaceae bacterium]|nr:MAG: EAL domain-containing protein [Methylococcaceae bacterium]